MRWSKVKQLIEGRFADSLHGRVEVHSTRYYSGEGRGWITVDKREVADFSTLGFLMQAHRESAVTLRQQGVYQQGDYHQLLWDSLSLSIDDVLRSDSSLIRALAMLDRRLGKRRLRALELQDDEHPLVRQFYELRCEAEGIKTDPIASSLPPP